MKKQIKKAIKYLSSLVFCNFYRILRIFPNNDPIMGCMLPFARRDKWWQTLLFPIVAIISFDFITRNIGIWTIGTTLTYSFVGLLFYLYFKNKKNVGLKTYAKSSVIGVLIFDFLTGPIMSSYLFKMPFIVATLGQIPFTIMHLTSAVTLTVILAPVLDPSVRITVQQAFAKHLHAIKFLSSTHILEVHKNE